MISRIAFAVKSYSPFQTTGVKIHTTLLAQHELQLVLQRRTLEQHVRRIQRVRKVQDTFVDAVQQLLLKANALLADAEKRTLSALLAERGLGRVQPEVTTRRRVVFSDHCGGSGGPVRRSARR